VARRLLDAGVAALDIAGLGGTSWAAVEAARATNQRQRLVAEAFVDWGTPTAEALRQVRQACPEALLIGSGGIRDGVDAAKAIRLGANLVAQAAAVLESALQSSEAVVEHFRAVIEQLRVVCFCTGSADLAALAQARLIDTGG
ncbi:alpha-hydroxy-acid oxidizing protein, partial [Stutzerimonas balearica]